MLALAWLKIDRKRSEPYIDTFRQEAIEEMNNLFLFSVIFILGIFFPPLLFFLPLLFYFLLVYFFRKHFPLISLKPIYIHSNSGPRSPPL